ncbi:MAG: ChaN family lipoprotein [Gammaproteobacteria bacterium]|nr:ChaN family lipoprotein [Gammaproteobacteria bacterium]
MTAVWQKSPTLVRDVVHPRRLAWVTLGLLGLLVLAGCEVKDDQAAHPAGEGHVHGRAHALPGHGEVAVLPTDAELAATPAIDLGTATDVSGLVGRIADRRIVYLGEQHDRYEQHLLQLAIVRGLHERGVPVAIGLEQFQRRFQPVLDAFIAGEIDTPEMLRRSEYYQRWRFDYRLYRPILDYAREHGIPLVALNAEVELTRRVGEVGLAGLDAAERAQLPQDYAPATEAYRERLRDIFSQHPGDRQRDFEHFVEAQLSWDETMAESAVNYLAAHPQRQLVVLVGAGHVIHRHGIPDRVQRRRELADAVVLLGGHDDVGPRGADWMLLPPPASLPPSGKMGILMEDSERGVRVAEVVPDSGAAAAGMRKDDLLTAIDGQVVNATGDVRVALFERMPGDTLVVTVRREDGESRLSLTLRAH